MHRTKNLFSLLAAGLSLWAGGGTPARAVNSSYLKPEWEKKAFAAPLAGRLEKINFASQALGETRPIYVYTPPGYGSARTYPVVVFLHGAPGNCLDWLYKGHAHEALDAAIRSGELPPVIGVFANGVGPFAYDSSEWADSYDSKCRMETATAIDLPRFLEARYRVAPNPDLWTLAGLSEGAYGAANLAVRRPERFRNSIVLSGNFLVSDRWPDTLAVFGKNPEFRLANSPLKQIERMNPADRAALHFYVAIGDSDTKLLAENEMFAATCRRLNVDLRYVRDDGKHDWNFWGAQLKASLPVLGGWLRTAGAR